MVSLSSLVQQLGVGCFHDVVLGDGVDRHRLVPGRGDADQVSVALDCRSRVVGSAIANRCGAGSMRRGKCQLPDWLLPCPSRCGL